MQCSSHNTAPCHLDVTSGHLACIEAPERAAHSGRMPNATTSTTKRTTIPKVTKTLASCKKFVSFTIVVCFVAACAAPARAAVIDPELRVVIRTYATAGVVSDLSP